jgi:hypothetical protein
MKGKRGNKEPIKPSGAEILHKAQLRSKLRYHGFMRPPTAWIEDPKMKVLETAFPGLQVLQTGRPPQPPPAAGTVGVHQQAAPQQAAPQYDSPFPEMAPEGASKSESGPGSSSINDFERMGGQTSGTVRSSAPKRRMDSEEGPSNSAQSAYTGNKKSNTASYDPQYGSSRSTHSHFPDPQSTYAHPLREKRKADPFDESEQRVSKSSKPNPTLKRKAQRISQGDGLRPSPREVAKKAKIGIPTTVKEKAAAFERATKAWK